MDFYDVLVWFGRHSAWLLLPAAGIIYTWILEARSRKDLNKEEWERGVHVSRLVKVFSFVGMVYGFFLMIGAVMMEITGSSPSLAFRMINGTPDGLGDPQDVVNHFTTIVYFVTGMVMFLKPLKDVPFASLISLAVASGLTIWAFLTIPDSKVGTFIAGYVMELKWLFLIIFLVSLTITFAVTKVSLSLMTTLSKIISKPPFAFIYASFVLVQAIVLLAGYSLVMW